MTPANFDAVRLKANFEKDSLRVETPSQCMERVCDFVIIGDVTLPLPPGGKITHDAPPTPLAVHFRGGSRRDQRAV